MKANEVTNPEQLIAALKYQFEGENIGLTFHAGWFELFRDLCFEIDSLLCEDKLGFHWTQLKEKFGAARWYISMPGATGSSPIIISQTEFAELKPGRAIEGTGSLISKISQLIQTAEAKTHEICMVCGNPGKIKPHGAWYACLCEAHSKQAKKNELPDFTYTPDSKYSDSKWW